MAKVNQYDQGFGGFGPMEQCSTGKWMKSAEVKAWFQELGDEADAEVYGLRAEIRELEEELQRCNQDLEVAHRTLRKSELYLEYSLIGAIIGLASLLAAVATGVVINAGWLRCP